jgi:hypothetical protein
VPGYEQIAAVDQDRAHAEFAIPGRRVTATTIATPSGKAQATSTAAGDQLEFDKLL